MTGSKTELGASTRAVATAVRRHRTRMGWSFARLSRELTKTGRDIPSLGLGRLEAGERRIDVDDLTALAVVFGVSPASLLMPDADEAEHLVFITGTDMIPADRAWQWLTGSYPLNGSVLAFYNQALPPWERDVVEGKIGAVRNGVMTINEARTAEAR